MLTGMVPQLEYDELKLGETNAISHFLASELKLAGKDSKQEATCLMINCLISDIIGKLGAIKFEEDEERKKKLKAEFEEKAMPAFFKTVVGLLEADGGKYLVGDQVSDQVMRHHVSQALAMKVKNI